MTGQSQFADYITRLRAFIAKCAPDDAAFAALARDLFALQYAHVPVYRDFCRHRGVAPTDHLDWASLPALPASAFRDYGVTSLPLAERAACFHSSGTTSHQPSQHFHNPASLGVYADSARTWFSHHFPDSAHHLFLSLIPSPQSAPHSSLARMMSFIRQPAEVLHTGHCAADGQWLVDVAATMDALAAQQPVRPVIILGTAFSFVHLCDALAAQQWRMQLPPGSCVMETGGYKGRSRELSRAQLHALISRTFGLPQRAIVCEYGMCELSSQAYDHVVGENAPRRFRFPPWARARVVSPETGRSVADGETGLLEIMDLANVHSVLAVQTADLAVKREDDFELIGRAAQSEPRGCSLAAANA